MGGIRLVISPVPQLPPAQLRAAIASLPEQASEFTGEVPDLRFVSIPAAHAKALSPDHPLVVGMRGSGKSFWWAALQSQDHRQHVAQVAHRTELAEVTWVHAAFGAVPNPDAYPSPDTLALLLDSADARLIWRTVMVKHLLWEHERRDIGGTWAQRLGWVQAHPEEVEQSLYAIDQRLLKEGKRHLILFDALDRTAQDWGRLRKFLRGLLQVLLEFRAYRAIRAKAFVRPDMLLDPEVTSFPDASKIITNDVRLDWRSTELYALLFQYLGNAFDPAGSAAFRSLCSGIGRQFIELDGRYLVPEALRINDKSQARIFHALCGHYMRRGSTPEAAKKGGVPYTWLPKHLADAKGQISPRSFLAAIRHALGVEKAGSVYPLHYEGLRQGVQKASVIRTTEVEEDFAWVAKAMEPLSKLLVPADEDQILDRWKRAGTLESISKVQGLQPRYLAEGGPGLIKEMVQLAFCERLANGRVNIPDVFRVGFGLGRYGGVKPVK